MLDLGANESNRWPAKVRKVIETWFLFRVCHDGKFSPSAPQPFLKPKRHRQLIFSVFKTLTDQTVIVELKNDLLITGVLKSVDQSVPRSSRLPLPPPLYNPRRFADR